MNKNGINISLDLNKAYEQTLEPIVSRASDTLISVWDMTLGTIDFLNEKSKLKRQLNIQEFKRELENKINSIPQENFIEPEISKIGPPLEASKYYFEEEDIRKMFANLIASSMDITKVNDVYPSFSEIIKQMSKLDAENLKLIYTGQPNSNLICQINLYRSNGSFATPFTNLFIANEKTQDFNAISASLSNLSRLGLITIDYLTSDFDSSKYDIFKESLPYLQSLEFCNSFNQDTEKTKQNLTSEEGIDKVVTFKNPELTKGLVNVSPFGVKFCEVCL